VTGKTSPPDPLSGAERGSQQPGVDLKEEPVGAIVPEEPPATATGPQPEEPIRCGRWKLKPFELPRPVLLRADGPLTLRAFLEHPDPGVLDELNQLDEEGLQQLALARLAGAPLEPASAAVVSTASVSNSSAVYGHRRSTAWRMRRADSSLPSPRRTTQSAEWATW